MPSTARPAEPTPAVVEGLERRSLLSAAPTPAALSPAAVGDPAADTAGPQLTSIRLVGPNQAVTAVVMTFNEALDPVKAQDLGAYVVLKKVREKGDDGDNFFGVTVGASDDQNGVRKLKFSSAVYDDTTHSVTITAEVAFRADKRFRQLRIAGKGDFALTDVAGNRLDGNNDGKNGDNALIKFHDRRSKKLNLKEGDGDKMSLRLKGPGRIISITYRKRLPSPIILLEGTVPGQSVLTGVVKKGKKGDGVFSIDQVSGTSIAQVTFLDNPAFNITETDA